MRLPLLCIFSFCLWHLSYGQDSDTTALTQGIDSVVVVQEMAAMDTMPEEKPQFIKPALSFDYGKMITNLAGLDEKYEAGASLLFLEQYLVTGEAGSAVLEPENGFRNGTYRSEGVYYRLGGGYVNQINPTSKLGIGALYGYSQFGHRGEVFITSSTDVQGDRYRAFDEPGLEARWLELFITSESWLRLNKENPQARINRHFALGFQVRFRFLTSRDSFPLFDVYMIPGYGRAINDPQLALNLFVKFYPF